MRVVLAKVIDKNIENQTVDVQDLEIGTIYKNVELDSDINFQQMPQTQGAINSSKGAVVLLVINNIADTSFVKIVKVWSTFSKYRRQLDENEVEIKSGDSPAGILGGSYVYLDNHGNVEIADGSLQNSIEIDREEGKVRVRASVFELINYSNIKILGDEDGSIVIENTGKAKIKIFPDGQIDIVSNENPVKINANSVEIKTKSNINLIPEQGQINLGEGADEKLILGDFFKALFNSHIHTTPVGPSSPPSQVMTDAYLSNKASTKRE